MSWFDTLVAQARAKNVADIHLRAGYPPFFRLPQGLAPVGQQPLGSQELEQLLERLLRAEQLDELRRTGEVDLAYQSSDGGRVRINCYRERGNLSLAVRLIPLRPPRLEELGLPAAVSKLAKFPDGLVIVAGPTGSGKSTTLAALIDQINRERAAHIVTIEDPIEYIHPNQRSLISQREVGSDTASFEEAMRRVLRQDPDVILIGECRDATTMRAALSAAETGHLVFCTLHTVSARESVSRVLELFPSDQHEQLRHSLAGVLRAVVVQRMLPRKDGQGKAVACEIMFASRRVQEAITDPERATSLTQIIEEGHSHYGMQSFNQALTRLVVDQAIDQQVAMAVSPSPQDLKLRLQQELGPEAAGEGGIRFSLS